MYKWTPFRAFLSNKNNTESTSNIFWAVFEHSGASRFHRPQRTTVNIFARVLPGLFYVLSPGSPPEDVYVCLLLTKPPLLLCSPSAVLSPTLFTGKLLQLFTT